MANTNAAPRRRVLSRIRTADRQEDTLECGHTCTARKMYGVYDSPGYRLCKICAEQALAPTFAQVKRVNDEGEVLYEPSNTKDMSAECYAIEMHNYEVVETLADQLPFTHKVIVDFDDGGEPWSYIVAMSN